MPITRVTLTTFLLTSTFLASAQEPYAEEIKRARELLGLIQQGQYEAFVAECDKTVAAALPAAKLEQAWVSTVAAYGEPQSEIQAVAGPYQKWIVVVLTHKTTTGALDTKITLDAALKVSGLFFTASAAAIEYQPPAYADSTRFTEEDITVTSGAFALPGTLTIPKGTGPFPAVVLVHGSGPNDRDQNIYGNRPFKDLAWGLAGRGVATLRYEKRTKQYGAALDPKTLTFDQEVVDDAIAAVRLLAGRKEIDQQRIFLVGHSLGAAAAPYIAAKESKIAGIVMLAAPARSIYELVPEQQEYIFKLDGRLGPAESAQLERVRAKVAAIRTGTYGADDKMLGAPSKYWHDLDRMDPVGYAKKLHIPILLVHGSRDYQVTPGEQQLFKEALAKQSNVTIKLVEGMDHLLRMGEGRSTPEQYQQVGHVAGPIVVLIADWVGSYRTAGSR